jgi:hypothetical protein
MDDGREEATTVPQRPHIAQARPAWIAFSRGSALPSGPSPYRIANFPVVLRETILLTVGRLIQGSQIRTSTFELEVFVEAVKATRSLIGESAAFSCALLVPNVSHI